MAKQEREQIGRFFITGEENLDSRGIICATCEQLLSRYAKETDEYQPSCKELLAAGAVPIPNFGWFCSQECADTYDKKFGFGFQRDADGKVSYY